MGVPGFYLLSFVSLFGVEIDLKVYATGYIISIILLVPVLLLIEKLESRQNSASLKPQKSVTSDCDFRESQLGGRKEMQKPPEQEIDTDRLGDKDYVLYLCRKDPYHLRLVSGALKSNKQIVLAALNRDISLVGLAGGDLKEDPEFIKECFGRCASEKAYDILLSELITNCPEIYRDSILRSIDSPIKSFRINHHNSWIRGNQKFADDADFVLKALQKCGEENKNYGWTMPHGKLEKWEDDYFYANRDLRNQKEIVLAALKHAPIARDHLHKCPIDTREYIPIELRGDDQVLQAEKYFTIRRIKSQGTRSDNYSKWVPDHLMKDFDVLKAIEEYELDFNTIAFY